MSDVVLDLDVLRPKKVIVKLGGHDIDCTFIPLGITFDLESITQKLVTLDQDEIMKGGEASREAFNGAVELCATFCAHQYPDMTPEWFMENVDGAQLQALADTIKTALQHAYDGIDPKNAEPAQAKN